MALNSLYTDTSAIPRPWRPPALYSQLPALAGGAGQQDPAQQMLQQMGSQQVEQPANSRAQELDQRIQAVLSGANPTTSQLKALMPKAGNDVMNQATQNKGMAQTYLNQLAQISQIGTTAASTAKTAADKTKDPLVKKQEVGTNLATAAERRMQEVKNQQILNDPQMQLQKLPPEVAALATQYGVL